jgi:hypothetical protein
MSEPARIPPAHLLPGDIKYESANGNVRIYLAGVTSIRPLSFIHTDPSFHQVTRAHTVSDCLNGPEPA